MNKQLRKKQATAPVKISVQSDDAMAEGYVQEFVIDESDIKLIIRALRRYIPKSTDEAGKHEILLEFFEMP